MDTMIGPRLEAWAALWSRYGVTETGAQAALAARFGDPGEAASAVRAWWRPILAALDLREDDPAPWAAGLVALGAIPADWPERVADGADPTAVAEAVAARLPASAPPAHRGSMPVQSLAILRLWRRPALARPGRSLATNG